jgi:cytochrome c-L
MRWNLHTAALTLAALACGSVHAQVRLYNPIEGTLLDFSGLKEAETPAVAELKKTGKNPYNKDAQAIKKGESMYATACSGCHGHLAEGKLGPNLTDDYWTYPVNKTDAGLFSSIYGGLQGMMGPQKGRITQDEILLVMSYVRSIYKGAPEQAAWLK